MHRCLEHLVSRIGKQMLLRLNVSWHAGLDQQDRALLMRKRRHSACLRWLEAPLQPCGKVRDCHLAQQACEISRLALERLSRKTLRESRQVLRLQTTAEGSG